MVLEFHNEPPWPILGVLRCRGAGRGVGRDWLYLIAGDAATGVCGADIGALVVAKIEKKGAKTRRVVLQFA